LGSLIFHYILFDPSNHDIIPDLLTICLSAINFIIPSWKINECIFKFDDEVVEETLYDDARVTFPTVQPFKILKLIFYFKIRIMIEQIQSHKKQP